MTLTRCRILLRRSGLLLLLLALVGTLGLGAAIAQDAGTSPTEPDPDLVARGDLLFGQNCAICHGSGGRGIESPGAAGGPPLIGVGAASVDFMLRTGRMPMADQRDVLRRARAPFSDTDREAIVAYVVSLAPGEGPGIPSIAGHPDADLARGLNLFTTNCAACHGSTAAGVAVGQRDVSSNLAVTTPLEIALAVRSGPGVMPRFGDEVMPQEDLEAVVAWVMNLREREAPGGVSIGRSGPVTEGFIAWLVGLGLLGIVMYLLGEKARDDEAPDHG